MTRTPEDPDHKKARKVAESIDASLEGANYHGFVGLGQDLLELAEMFIDPENQPLFMRAARKALFRRL